MLNILKDNNFKIFSIILISLIIDNLLILTIESPPAWDQGYHLSNVFKMYNILGDGNLNFINKSDHLLNITTSYRGPLTYFLSAIFLKLFKNSYQYAYLSNQLFNIICIISIYKLAKLFRDESTGVWACLIFTFSPFIINQRIDYLIDLSLTSFSTLSLLFFTKWFICNKKNYLISILSGISLGLIFLVKPTGIIFFILPLITIILKKINNQKEFLSSLYETFLFILSFVLIIFPWFSKHWLTIITSTINAWNWGINYQDGLDINSFSSWLFYFKTIPIMFGIINFSVFLLIFIFEKISSKNLFETNIKKLKKYNLWFFIYILNCYLIASLMSTKDIRFIMPVFPLLCIYIANFINSKNNKLFKSLNKKIILLITIFSTLLVSNDGLIVKNLESNKKNNWPHYEIMNKLKKSNPYLVTTLAVLPDTKEINTFNLEAEAARQGGNVAVRQIVSNKNSYKKDLEYFDWFLVKTQQQGVMTSQSKQLLNEYLLKNSSFTINDEWNLPDKSKVILLRRRSINSSVNQIDCSFKNPEFDIKQINNGINIIFRGKGSVINSSNLMIDFKNKDFKKSTNISLANGLFAKSLKEDKCYFLSQEVPVDFPKNISSNISNNLFVKVRLLKKGGEIDYLENIIDNFLLDEKLIGTDYILMTNRITKVENLGKLLKDGRFEDLFNLVGVINQSDPEQKYLYNAEKIYLERYKENQTKENLYNILISQILQRKIIEAEKTINMIIEVDNNNGNAHLTKAIINTYLFNRKGSRTAIYEAKQKLNSEENKNILKIIEGINYILEMNFINAYKTFT